jgi:creatinine amidohydrolase
MKIKKCFALTMSITLFFTLTVNAQDKNPTTRKMNLLTWTEFAEFVPRSIETVLLPTGSIEPHGVIPSGADNIQPTAMADAIAERLNALIAPTLNYGITPRMQAYPGAVSIGENAYTPFVKDLITGLAKNKFKNIIILNGHGGNTNSLNSVVNDISDKYQVRIAVINWWSLTLEETFAVFGENGGHAGNNETAYTQAIVPEHIHLERYSKEMAIPLPTGNSYYAVPVPSSILLYEKDQGYPTFSKEQADEYFKRVNIRVTELIEDIIKKWNLAGLYR